MMRALAEFIMRGRPQAGVVAVLGNLIPLLGSMTVAMVALRKGGYEGGVILVLAAFPAILSLVLGNTVSIVVWMTLLSLVTVYILSLVLRATISLPFTVMAALLISVCITGGVWLLLPESVYQMIEAFSQQLEVPAEQDPTQVATALFSPIAILGLIACMLSVNGIMGVFLGRWLQAMLFNPGGFGIEFRSLRLGLVASTLCFASSLLVYYQGNGYLWWAYTLALPLVLVALAIAHSLVISRNLPLPLLVLYYFMAIAFMPIVVCIGFIDVWVDFRNRLSNK